MRKSRAQSFFLNAVIITIIAAVYMVCMSGTFTGYVNETQAAPVFYTTGNGVAVEVSVSGKADLGALAEYAARQDAYPLAVFLCPEAVRLNQNARGKLSGLYMGMYDCGEHGLNRIEEGEYVLLGPDSHHTGKNILKYTVDYDALGEEKLAESLFDGAIVKTEYKDVATLKKIFNIIVKSGYNIIDLRKTI